MTDHAPSVPPPAQAAQPRPRPMADHPALFERAAALLRTPSALAEMDADDARCVVASMRLLSFGAGSLLLREGDGAHTSYLLLILSGDVRVQTFEPSDAEPIDISVLGPGHVIGEMGLIDAEPRSATCTALTVVEAAGLSRKALDQMIDEQPQVAAKLMVALCKRLSDRLRALGDQLGIYARLARDAQAAGRR